MTEHLNTLSLVEPGIILHREQGRITPDVYRQAVADRIQFADQHQLTQYVLVADFRTAQSDLNTFSLSLARWSLETDPRLIHTVVIGQRGLVRVAIKLVQAVLDPTLIGLELCDDLPQALTRARQVYSGRTSAS
jgi:hypothetical protein